MMRYAAEYSTILDLIQNIYSLLYSILCTYIYIMYYIFTIVWICSYILPSKTVSPLEVVNALV